MYSVHRQRLAIIRSHEYTPSLRFESVVFDSRLRPLIDPPLNAAGHRLAALGVSADQVTLAGFIFGLLAAGAIGAGAFFVGLVLVVANRLCDGLDGAVARASAMTDRGGY